MTPVNGTFAQTFAANCPAFKTGCPYKDSVGDGPHSKLDEMLSTSLKNCPAFGSTSYEHASANTALASCPFRTASNLGAVGETISQMPASHSEQGSKANDAFVQSLKMMHSTSLAAKGRSDGRACPVFDSGCPFKQCVTSVGKPLVKEMEVRSWFAGQEEKLEEQPQAAEEKPLEIHLSKMLKVGTQAAHKEAESGSFVKRLLRGRSSPEEYRRLIVDLHLVYEALETSLEHAASTLDHAIVKSIHFPQELNRTDSLRRDLEFWFRDVPGGVATAQPSPPAVAYAERVKHISEDPGTCHLLVAHAYTRYLGDLSGGQLLKRSICRAMPVGSDGEGVEFYDFQNVDHQKDFKNRYRDQLDELEVAPEIADEMVEEANKAFDYNGAIFRHLDEVAGIEVPKPTLPAGHPTLAADASLAECPFAALAAQARAEEKADAIASRSGNVSPAGPKRAILGRWMQSLQCPFASLAGQAPTKNAQRTPSSGRKCMTAIVGSFVLFGPVLLAGAVHAMSK
mmetsp:Transcript_41247/g.94900  ORF Transcript_41247/g.94900 Transcript_41247/m.94900 type:complete len:511 (+) Transcript_41247:75-1607(+)